MAHARFLSSLFFLEPILGTRRPFGSYGPENHKSDNSKRKIWMWIFGDRKVSHEGASLFLLRLRCVIHHIEKVPMPCLTCWDVEISFHETKQTLRSYNHEIESLFQYVCQRFSIELLGYIKRTFSLLVICILDPWKLIDRKNVTHTQLNKYI